MSISVEEITRYPLCSSFSSHYINPLPSFINLYLFNPFPRHCLHKVCNLKYLKSSTSPRLYQSETWGIFAPSFLVFSAWVDLFFKLRHLSWFLELQSSYSQVGFELQKAVLELCCWWPRLDPYHQGQSHPFCTPGFLAEVYHKLSLSLEACEFVLSEPSVAPSSLPYYCCSNQKQVCSASLGSDTDGWLQPLGTNNTKESSIHTSAKPVCVAKASIFHDQTSKEQFLL